MRALPALALVAALALAGCSSGGGGDPYFPKPSKLPEGWQYAYGPEESAPSERSRSGAEEMRVAGLAGPAGATGSIVVMTFDTKARAKAVADQEPCDGTSIYRTLLDGRTVVFLGVESGASAGTRAAMDDVAGRIRSASGADTVC